MVRNIQIRVSLKEEEQLGLKAKTARYLGASEDEIEIFEKDIDIFDVYQGKSIEDGKKSVVQSTLHLDSGYGC